MFLVLQEILNLDTAYDFKWKSARRAVFTTGDVGMAVQADFENVTIDGTNFTLTNVSFGKVNLTDPSANLDTKLTSDGDSIKILSTVCKACSVHTKIVNSDVVALIASDEFKEARHNLYFGLAKRAIRKIPEFSKFTISTTVTKNKSLVVLLTNANVDKEKIITFLNAK
jgi:hypothetical protein